jgi:hypothetical protein
MFRRKDAILPTAGWSNDRRANGDTAGSGLSKSFIASMLWLLSSILLLFGGYYYCKLNQQQTTLECGADSCRIAMLTGGTLTEQTLARDQLLRADYIRLNKAGEIVDTSAMKRKQLNELGATYGIVYRERVAPVADDDTAAKADDAAAADVHALEEGAAGKPAGVPDAAHAAGERLKAKWASRDKRRRDIDQHDKPADAAADAVDAAAAAAADAGAQQQEPAAAAAAAAVDAAAVVGSDNKPAAAAIADSKVDTAQQVNELLAERLKNLEAVMAESKAAMEALLAQHEADAANSKKKVDTDNAAAAADDNKAEGAGRKLAAAGTQEADLLEQPAAAIDSSKQQQQQQQQHRRLVSAAAAAGLKDSLHAVAEQHAQGVGAVKDAAAAFTQLLLPNGAAAAVPLANGEQLLPLTRWDLGRRRATAGRKAVEAYILRFKGSEDTLLLEESVFWRLFGIWLMAIGAASAVVAAIVGDFKPAAKPRKRHL